MKQQQQRLIELREVDAGPKTLNGKPVRPILHAVSLSVHASEWITVAGRNGSGKSTLAKLLAGLPNICISSGSIEHGGTDSEGGREPGAVPIVMQHPDAGLIGSTPWEDVVLMLERHGHPEQDIPAKAESALVRVGLGGRMNQRIDTLSGGQKQLAAIAGCLAVSPSLLLLDEATSMLDPVAAEAVLAMARQLNGEGTAIVWITQLMDELRSDDRVVALEEGKMVFNGRGHQFFARSVDEQPDSPGEHLGFKPPYATKVAWELGKLGIRLDPLPLSMAELKEATDFNDG